MTPPQETGRPRSPREQLVAEFQERLQAGWAPSVREETLGHAAMRGALDQRLGRVRAQISLFDRLVFFVDTPAEQLEDELEARAAWHRGEAQRLWGDLLELAQHSGSELAPFAARDQVIAARQALDAVHTDGGSSSVPMSCSVYGRDDVLSALEDLRKTLAGRFHLEGTREELVSAIARHPHVEGEPPPPGPFQPLERDELLRRLALQLQPEGFAEHHRELLARRKERQRVDFEERVAGEKVSIWDKINVFTTTPEEAQRDELREQLGKLSAEIARDMQHLDRLLDAALRRVYPPALPYFAVGGVASAVLEIRAVCRSYTVSTGTGKNRRTETRYRCDLLGKSAAQAAMGSLGARVVETFGVLPGYNELLEVSELEGIAAALAEERRDAPR